jgi:hypothetical protein
MTKGKQAKQRQQKMGKSSNKGAVRCLVESGLVKDMGSKENKFQRQSTDLVKSWTKKLCEIRVVDVQEEVKRLQTN